MFGLFQTVFYFSYMALGSMALGILCGNAIYLHAFSTYYPNYYASTGTVGYIGTRLFVRKIYATVKID